MKKNFMIAVNKDNAEAYKQTLIALGYKWSYNLKEGWWENHVNSIYGHPIGQEYCWFSTFTCPTNEGHYFKSIEDFLIWHFAPEKTQAEVELEKLQEQIVSLQHQAEKLKASL